MTVKCSKKKDCEHVLKAENDLRNRNTAKVDVSTGSVKIKFQENSTQIYNFHLQDFKKYIPEIELEHL